MTASSCPPAAAPLDCVAWAAQTRAPAVEGEGPLERVGGVQEAVLGEGGSGQLQADRQARR